MEDSKMKKHVTVVGAIQIGFAILGLDSCSSHILCYEFCKRTGWRDDTGRWFSVFYQSVCQFFSDFFQLSDWLEELDFWLINHGQDIL